MPQTPPDIHKIAYIFLVGKGVKMPSPILSMVFCLFLIMEQSLPAHQPLVWVLSKEDRALMDLCDVDGAEALEVKCITLMKLYDPPENPGKKATWMVTCWKYWSASHGNEDKLLRNRHLFCKEPSSSLNSLISLAVVQHHLNSTTLVLWGIYPCICQRKSKSLKDFNILHKYLSW